MPSDPSHTFEGFPGTDADWEEHHWKTLIEHLVEGGHVTWARAAALVLGHLNPSQVGTSIASKQSFQSHFPRRETWMNVRQWHFQQSGECIDCGTRLELQADHLISKQLLAELGAQIAGSFYSVLPDNIEEVKETIDRGIRAEIERCQDQNVVTESLRIGIRDDLISLLSEGTTDRGRLAEVADRLDNMVLRCRRCNVIRRPSHAQGGLTFLTAEAALMWILFVKRPSTYQKFHDICRAYGLTMANIRFEEAWAMAIWLNRNGQYQISAGSQYGPVEEG